jgi:hypothetical protein
MAAENLPHGVGMCPDCGQPGRVLWPFDGRPHAHIDEGALLRCGCGNSRPARVRVCIECFGDRAGAEDARREDPADAAVLSLAAAQSGPEPAAVAAGLEERRAS